MRFSKRYGYKSVRQIIQKESMDDDLKNRLWNCVLLYIFQKYKKKSQNLRSNHISESNLDAFFYSLFHIHLKKRIDQIPSSFEGTVREIENLFFNKYKWYEIYDFVEFSIQFFPFSENKDRYTDILNRNLEKENSAYRVVNEKIIEITSEQEIQSIEEALENTNPYSGVQQHLNQALKLMSVRQNPDYRNSMKESISAVEGICRIISGDKNNSFQKAIAKIENKYLLHSSLKEGFNKLYSYTSDGDGIRHALMEESNLTYIDAKFMLVACTNFINYLVDKTKDPNRN